MRIRKHVLQDGGVADGHGDDDEGSVDWEDVDVGLDTRLGLPPDLAQLLNEARGGAGSPKTAEKGTRAGSVPLSVADGLESEDRASSRESTPAPEYLVC
jgi:hypothetical protein